MSDFRLKVFQSVAKMCIRDRFFSLSKAYDLYNYLLMLMIALTEYAQKRIDAAKAKLAPTKEELYLSLIHISKANVCCFVTIQSFVELSYVIM